MQKIRNIALVVGTAVLVMAAPSAAAAKATKTSCATAKGSVNAVTLSARVYTVGDRVYGCWLKTHRRTLLGSDATKLPGLTFANIFFDGFALAGSEVAYSATSYEDGEVGGEASAPLLVDLKTGRRLQQPRVAGSVQDVFALPDNTLVWLGDGPGCTGPGLHAAGPSGMTVLACGADIADPAVAGTWLYWHEGAAAHGVHVG